MDAAQEIDLKVRATIAELEWHINTLTQRCVDLRAENELLKAERTENEPSPPAA